MPGESKSKCDSRCWNSKTSHCDCACGGANHGKGEAGRDAVYIAEADTVAANELVLFIENDSDLYRQQQEPILKNLERKLEKGTYDSEKAIRLWEYLVESGAKKYTKENGTPGGPNGSYGSFDKATRRLAAIELRNNYEKENRVAKAAKVSADRAEQAKKEHASAVKAIEAENREFRDELIEKGFEEKKAREERKAKAGSYQYYAGVRDQVLAEEGTRNLWNDASRERRMQALRGVVQSGLVTSEKLADKTWSELPVTVRERLTSQTEVSK